MLTDVKEATQSRDFLMDIYLNSISFYQGIGLNYEKLKQNAKKEKLTAGGVIF